MLLKNQNKIKLNYYNSKFKKKEFPLVVVTDRVLRPANIGGLIRISDAFGVKKIYFGGPIVKLNNKVWNISRSTEKEVDFEQNEDTINLIKNLKQKKYKIVAIEITKKSIPISKIEFENKSKIVLLIGSERYGIDSKLLNLADSVYHIEMFGQNSSMNVVQAASIALYETTKILDND